LRPRPPISALPIGLQRDIRAFFGNYSNACRLADDLLFRAGSAEAVGKLLPTALYVHCIALEALDPLLRVYVGRARAYIGTPDGANYVHCIALEALDPLLRVYEGRARAYIGTLDGANLIKLETIPVSLDIFYVFKDGTLQQQYLANRYRLRAATPQKRISELRSEEHRDLLEPSMAAIAELRRLPSLTLRLVRDQGRNWRQRSRLLTYPQPVSSGKMKK
jgi:hypothetical protein